MTRRINNIKKRLSDGGIPLGAMLMIASPEIVEIVGHVGYDYALIDCEHSSFSLDVAVAMIRAAEATGVTPIVRVPDHSPSFIMKVLDAGAMGIIVPHVTNRSEAQRIVSAAKYRTARWPQGTRGACPSVRATAHQTRDWPSYSDWANDNTTVWFLIEDVEAVENLDEINDVAGVDAVLLGAFDLSVSMGYGGDRNHPAVMAKVDEIIAKTRAKGVDVVGLLYDATLEQMAAAKKRYAEQGCRILIAGFDRRLLVNGLQAIVDAMR